MKVLLKTREKIKNLGDILELFQKEEEEEEEEEERKLEGEEEKLIEILVTVRDKLRQKKDWKLADEIRKN